MLVRSGDVLLMALNTTAIPTIVCSPEPGMLAAFSLFSGQRLTSKPVKGELTEDGLVVSIDRLNGAMPNATCLVYDEQDAVAAELLRLTRLRGISHIEQRYGVVIE